MATGKLNTELALSLGFCWTQEQCEEFAEKHGGNDEFTVDALLLAKHISYDDAMFGSCSTAVTPVPVLREFAAQIARENLVVVAKAKGGARPLSDAVEFIESGTADDDPDTLAQHAENIQNYMVGQLVIEGIGDAGDPVKVARHEALLCAAKAVRAATKPNAGEAAYSAANWAYKAVSGEKRDKLGLRHRGQLAKIFRELA